MSQAGSLNYFDSSPGKKVLMGVTGLIWSGFVLAHMLGNLLLFVGPEAYNRYAHFLTSGSIIYVAEAALILSILVHVVMALRLTWLNRRARGPQRYAMSPQGEKAPSLASRTMAVHGTIILVFLITHLLGFKFGTYYETAVNGVVMRDLYRLVVEVFSNPLAVGWYLLALVLLGMHLSHGFGSVFQSLGLMNRKNREFFRRLSMAYALLVTLGFVAQPIYIFIAH